MKGFYSNGRSDRQNQVRDEIYLALKNAGFDDIAERFYLCQSSAPENNYGWWVCPDNPDHPPQPIVGTCHLPFACEECAHRATMDLIRRYRPVIRHYGSKNSTCYMYQYIVLTTRISLYDPDAREQCDRLWKKDVDRLFDQFLGRKWHKQGQGFIAVSEFGLSGKRFHINIVFYGRIIKRKDIQPLWQAFTGCAGVYTHTLEGAEAAIQKLAYSTKFTHFTNEGFPVLMKVMEGKRRIRSRGIFYHHGFEKEHKETRCPTCGEPAEYYRRWEFEARQEERADRSWTAETTPAHLILIKGNKSIKPAPLTLHTHGPGPPPWQSSRP